MKNNKDKGFQKDEYKFVVNGKVVQTMTREEWDEFWRPINKGVEKLKQEGWDVFSEKNTHLSMCQLESLGFEVVKSEKSEHQVKQIRSNGLLAVVTVWEMPSGAFVEQIIREL